MTGSRVHNIMSCLDLADLDGAGSDRYAEAEVARQQLEAAGFTAVTTEVRPLPIALLSGACLASVRA